MRLLSTVLLLTLTAVPAVAADLHWHDDYATAYLQAQEAQKLLLISFCEEDRQFVPPREAVNSLQPFVLLKVPTTATAKDGEKEHPLIRYGCFRGLNGGPGLAVLNLKYEGPRYGNAVGTLTLEAASDSATRVVQFLEAPERELGPKVMTDELGLTWHTDYTEAYATAKREKKLFLVAFDSEQERFSPDGKTVKMLRDLVLARLRVEDSGRLLNHHGFRQFHCSSGIGLIDLAHEGEDYGRVVQVIPSEYLTMEGTRVALELAGGRSEPPALRWLTDYHQARAAAAEQKKMLLIAIDSDDEVFTPQPKSVPLLHSYVLLRQHTQSEYEHQGKRRRLLRFADFASMREKPGLVIYNFKHEDKPYYQQVVSAMPYQYLGPNPGNRVFSEEEREYEFLILEPNTLTRRTLTWAIRVSKAYGSNQRLRSADGRPSERLMSGALRNSRLQCRSGVGHFAGGLSGAEIASPGPGKDIVDGALNMVRIWRSSPPHYGTMVRYHREFGYDMAQNSTNHWYGTGRF